MKKVLKITLLMTITIIAFLILGSTEVKAANLVEFEDENDISITELNMGNLPYDTSVTKTFQIKNKTSADITITNMAIADMDKYEFVNTPATTIPANGEITIEIKNKAGISVSATSSATKIMFTGNNGAGSSENIEFSVTGMIVPKELAKPTVKGTYTFKITEKYEQVRQYFEFNDYDNFLMSMSGETSGISAGNYDMTISLADTTNYAWVGGGTDPLQFKITIGQLQLPPGETPPLPDNVRTSGIGYKLSTIKLTAHNWAWTNPEESIKAEEHNYLITYIGGNYVGFDNYTVMNKDGITGLVPYKVTIQTGANAIVSSANGAEFEVLAGGWETVRIMAKPGYDLISIKMNDVEQLSGKIFDHSIKLPNMTENILIEVETERRVVSLVSPTETPIFKIGSDKTLNFVFDKKMMFSLLNEVIVNGKAFTYSETIERFNLILGDQFGLEIKNEYLSTLAPGTYDIQVGISTKELIEATFVVEDIGTITTTPQTYIKGSNEKVIFNFAYDFSKFNLTEVRLNSKVVSTEDILKYFTFKEGSTIVEISSEYLETLGLGTYDLEIDVAIGDTLKSSFEVKEKVEEELNNPNTGDNIILYSTAVIVAAIGSIGVVVTRKKSTKRS